MCGSLNVSWSPGSTSYPLGTHEKRYDLRVSVDGGAYTDVSGYMNTTATALSPPVTNPAEGVTHSYRVRAWYVWNTYTSNKTGWVTDSVAQPVCPPIPDAPTLSQPSIVNSQIVLDWTHPVAGLDHRLERRDLTIASARTQIYSGTGTGHTDTGATSIGHTYEYRARTCNSVPSCGAWSAPVDIDLYQNVDTRYQYDALGRLVRVVENESIRTGYCYDRAGNRYQVDAGSGGGENCPAEPAPSAPTGLSAVWQTGPSWHISWNPVNGAVSYKLQLTVGTVITLSGTSYTSNPDGSGQPPAPVWVRACNYNDSCGSIAYFP
jgi:YD repeat-containing protein